MTTYTMIIILIMISVSIMIKIIIITTNRIMMLSRPASCSSSGQLTTDQFQLALPGQPAQPVLAVLQVDDDHDHFDHDGDGDDIFSHRLCFRCFEY